MRIPLGRLSLPAITLLVAALTCGTLSAPAHADADNPETTASTEAATDALEQVQEILADPAAANADGRDLTVALRDLRMHQDDLPASQRATAKRIVSSRPLPDSAPHQDYGSVRVHWAANDSAVDNDPAWRDEVGAVVNHVLSTYTAAGYRAPMSDGTLGGGSGLLDIYLVDFANDERYGLGLYGFCDAAASAPQSGPYNVPAFCAFNHDFSEFPALSRSDNLKVTAAHELFHATQFAYDYYEDAWFLEATAAWAEDEVYDSINDNRQYLPLSPLAQPGQSLDEFGRDLRHYGRWIFFRYLSERFSKSQGGLPVIVRRMWERADSTRGPAHDLYSIQAVNRELASQGTDLRRAYALFADANRHPARSYEEGSHYRASRAAHSWTFTPKRHDTRWQTSRVDHLATATMQVKPSAAMKRWRLRVQVDLPNRALGMAAIVTKYDKRGRPSVKQVKLTAAGKATVRLAFDARRVSRVDVTLSNASIRYRKCWTGTRPNGIQYSCSGIPRDENAPMRYRISALR